MNLNLNLTKEQAEALQKCDLTNGEACGTCALKDGCGELSCTGPIISDWLAMHAEVERLKAQVQAERGACADRLWNVCVHTLPRTCLGKKKCILLRAVLGVE